MGSALNHLMLPSSIRSKMSHHGNPTSLIVARCQKRDRQREGEMCPVESLIEWRRNGAHTPSRDCSINNAAEETNSSHLWALFVAVPSIQML